MADPRTEKEAQALQRKAIDEDNLNVNYAGAIKKLEAAVAKCGSDKCNSALKAAIFRDLGAMQVLNGAVDDGKGNFAQAIGLDPSIALDPAYKTPQLEGVWDDVKKNGAPPAAAATSKSGAAPAAAAAPIKAGPQPTEGDFTHTPPPEAPVRTPLPVYVEYNGDEDLTKVTVKYKGAGMGDWKVVELPKTDSGGYGGLIPCKDVSRGLMRYFVQGFNDKNDVVASSGSKKLPYNVPINAQLVGPPPSLPGQDPPAQCEDVAGGGGTECPPDFPGCGNKKGADEDCDKNADCDSGVCSDGKCAAKKDIGDDCHKDEECSSGTCSSGKCSAGDKKLEGDDCEADEDCLSGRCKDDKCAAGEGSSRGGKRHKLWIGLGVQADIDIMPGANDVCELKKGLVNSAGYGCVLPGGSVTFPDTGNDNTNYNNIVQGEGDQVEGGLKLGNIRIMASLDYALGKSVLLGARLGYVMKTDPAVPAFPPLHIEGRLEYVFGKEGVYKLGLSPMIELGLGVGELDAYVPVTVHLSIGGKDVPGTANSWLVSGPFFLSGGVGVRYLLSSRIAFTGLLKAQAGLGGAAGVLPGIAPEVGVQFGL